MPEMSPSAVWWPPTCCNKILPSTAQDRTTAVSSAPPGALGASLNKRRCEPEWAWSTQRTTARVEFNIVCTPYCGSLQSVSHRLTMSSADEEATEPCQYVNRKQL